MKTMELELPDPLHERLQTLALQHGRSFAREVIALLTQAAPPPSAKNEADLLERIHRRRKSMRVAFSQEELDRYKNEGRP